MLTLDNSITNYMIEQLTNSVGDVLPTVAEPSGSVGFWSAIITILTSVLAFFAWWLRRQ